MTILFLSINNIVAQNYDFKAENEDNVIIYYKVDGNNVKVTFGEDKYKGHVKIPSVVQYNGHTYYVTSIDNNAFYFCQALESIELPENVAEISNYAFSGCSGLKSVHIPLNVHAIGRSAFYGCNKLEAIKFPSNLERIGELAFYGCDKISSISIPSSVTFIGNSAFANSLSLQSISVDADNKVYDSRQNCNGIIETETNKLIIGCKATLIPEGVIAIGDNAFYFCQVLESIELPVSITEISDYAFCGCNGLKSVHIPVNVNAIGRSAFYGCNELEAIEFPSNLERIGEQAFYGCYKISSISIPSSVTFIGNSAFANCPSLVSISVDTHNKVYDSRQDCNGIIETETNKLIVGCKTTLITKGVTAIGNNAFYFSQTLESIDLPVSITEISDYAFYGCVNIKSIKSHIKVPFDIGNNVFNKDVKMIASLYVPDGTKYQYQKKNGWDFASIIETSGDDNNEENSGDSNSEISLVVWAKDGSKVAFALSKRPKVTFSETDLIIIAKDFDANYPLENMARLTYEMVNTAIKDIKNDKVSFRFTGESLLFPVLKANSTMSVYSLNGALVFKKTLQEAGDYSFSISNLNTGVYLVSVNGLTYKIVKK